MDNAGRVELPATFEEADIDYLVLLIADMLERLIAHNDRIPLQPESLTRFHSRTTPNISVLDYLRRVVRFTKVEKSCLLLTLHYVDQISITVSSKGLCDTFCTNNLYAKVGGISVAELNVLEREFLRVIDWRLTCTSEVLQEYYINLIRTHSLGGFIIASNRSTSSGSSDSDMDSGPSRPPSPPESQMRIREASTILIDTATLSPQVSHGPTIEQNMAFAALQESWDRTADDSMSTG